MSLKKLVQKVILSLLFLAPSTALADIKMDGPKNIEPGELGKINIEGINGLNDPVIKCFPENDSWEAVRRLDGSPFILFYTKKEGLYTFIVAGNKDNKTILSVFQIVVGKTPSPTPIPPAPVPGGKYTSRLKPSYMVSPDNQSLIKLIKIYGDCATNASSFTDYKHVQDALALETKNQLGNMPLRAVRDSVADILQADLAQRNGQTYSADATKAIFNELVMSLTPLLEGK